MQAAGTTIRAFTKEHDVRSKHNPVYLLLNKDYPENFDAYSPRKADFHDLVSAHLPAGWEIHRRGTCFHCGSPQNILPQQGWKIHVSAKPANAREILQRVISILLERRDTDFKFALDMSTLFLLNSKNWPRGASGKFITIYPPDNHHFLDLIEQLHQNTQGLQGPYLLSDHRYKDSSVVFYRYGGMRLYDVLNTRGERTPMLVAPDGSEIPDLRLAYPVTPSWAPAILPPQQSQSQSEDTDALKNGRYRIEDVLSFSNAGGVYRGSDRETGKSVVIKEARPYVNSATDGYDAVELLKKEHRLLNVLADTGIAPQPVDLFREWEHWFLVEERIEGIPLASHSTRHNILLRTRCTAEDYAIWYKTFRSLSASLATTIEILHSRNVVFADLSTNNLMVLEGKAELRLIDFEGAYQVGCDPPTNVYTPGFISAERLAGSEAGFEDDYYAAGAVLMAYLLPVNGLFHLKPWAKQEIMSCIRRDARLPKTVADMVLALMNQNPKQRPRGTQMLKVLEAAPEAAVEEAPPTAHQPDYLATIEGIAAHINATATFERQDRLFPSDPKLFVTNPLSLAYGGAGVAYALSKITGKRQDAAIDWILRRKVTAETYPPGLYIGTAGIAWSLLEMGAQEEAERMLQASFRHRLLHRAPDIFYGMAGVGLTSLHFFCKTGNELYLDKAKEAGNTLLEVRHKCDSGCYWDSVDELCLGLAHGAGGIALFLLYLYLATGDGRFVEAGQQGLDFDLSFATETKDGGLSWPRAVHEASPLYPYWRFGSAGLGTVVLRYFMLLRNDQYDAILKKIYVDADRSYSIFPGRFLGLAGLGDFLLDLYEFTGATAYLESSKAVAQGILRFRVERNGIAFPGELLSRLSCDYGTGSAGIALFFNRIVGRQKTDFMLDDLFEQAGVTRVGVQRSLSAVHPALDG